jgi:hypothetical protein
MGWEKSKTPNTSRTTLTSETRRTSSFLLQQFSSSRVVCAYAPLWLQHRAATSCLFGIILRCMPRGNAEGTAAVQPHAPDRTVCAIPWRELETMRRQLNLPSAAQPPGTSASRKIAQDAQEEDACFYAAWCWCACVADHGSNCMGSADREHPFMGLLFRGTGWLDKLDGDR